MLPIQTLSILIISVVMRQVSVLGCNITLQPIDQNRMVEDTKNLANAPTSLCECRDTPLDYADLFQPNDEQEQDRLDMLHHIYLLVQGGRLHTAPIVSPQLVLDIGTGTGIWALDFAE